MAASAAEQAAQRYVPGRGPVSIERLGAGLVNESYRALREGRVYALRIPAPNPLQLGVDREWECRVLARASAAGIAPVIERCEPRHGVLVARWVEGRSMDAQEARRPAATALLALLACRVHALPPPAPARILGPRDWIHRYRDGLSPMAPDAAPRRLADRADLKEAAERRLRALESLPRAALVLCHSDLHAANLVAPVLLDWEYAHVSEALWDLAGWACNTDLDGQARALLLASYFGRPPTKAETERFEHLRWLYDYVCVLWSAVYLGTVGAPDGRILDRARLCIVRLEHGASGDAGGGVGGGVGELPAH
jgi:thiamine kinase-like enzyme